jgi:uncharacterized protein (DUF2147 family)
MFIALVWLAGSLGSTQYAEGYWITADRRALVRIAPCGTKLCGKISRVLAGGPKVPSGDVNNPQPSLRSRPLVGLQVLSGFKLRGSNWVEGRAYDPKSGQSYNAKLTPNPDGTLTVTGCVLFICRSQTWHRT